MVSARSSPYGSSSTRTNAQGTIRPQLVDNHPEQEPIDPETRLKSDGDRPQPVQEGVMS